MSDVLQMIEQLLTLAASDPSLSAAERTEVVLGAVRRLLAALRSERRARDAAERAIGVLREHTDGSELAVGILRWYDAIEKANGI